MMNGGFDPIGQKSEEELLVEIRCLVPPTDEQK